MWAEVPEEPLVEPLAEVAEVGGLSKILVCQEVESSYQ